MRQVCFCFAFTLIEVLVALVIITVVGFSLLSSDILIQQQLRDARAMLLALQTAEVMKQKIIWLQMCRVPISREALSFELIDLKHEVKQVDIRARSTAYQLKIVWQQHADDTTKTVVLVLK